MQDKVLKVIGFWAMGLILFVATLIVIRWVIDFVTWSALDSGWAQVLGSIAALIGAILIMGHQNSSAARLVADSDRRGRLLRATSVHAILNDYYNRLQIMRMCADILPPAALSDSWAISFKGAAEELPEMRDTLRTIPAYDLGAYDLVEGLHFFIDLVKRYSEINTRLHAHPEDAGTIEVIASTKRVFEGLDIALKRFEAGLRRLQG